MAVNLGKSELLVIHKALYRVRLYLEQHGLGDAGGFEAYDKHGVTPLTVYRSRSEHYKAVMLLATALGPTESDAPLVVHGIRKENP